MNIIPYDSYSNYSINFKDFTPLPFEGIITESWFTDIVHWTEDDCLQLVRYYHENERTSRKGWNNNMSLVNQEGQAGDVVWSLIYWKFEFFKTGIPVIIPFILQPDERGLLRATTTLQKIRDKAIFCSPELQAVATGERRNVMVEGFCGRILDGFHWRGKKGSKKNKIRRYRLVALLNSPKIDFDSDFDVHHLNGVKELLKGNKTLAATDDRSLNIEVQHKTQHRRNHYYLNDKDFRDYRKSKQLELDID